MPKTLLLTGGAGFTGSHLCIELMNQGHRVRIVDGLSDQVHGGNEARPACDVELIRGDIRDPSAVARAERR
jgi:dTDP-L-rhamnose 4-epimerase